MDDLSKMTKWDIIVVGAGGSGAALAKTLSGLVNNSILVLEMGKNHFNDTRVTNSTQDQVARSVPDVTNDYLTARDSNLYNKQSDIKYGRGWGGSTANSYMYAIRPSQGYLNQLATITGVPLTTINGYFSAVETFIPQSGLTPDSSRGTTGPMAVTQMVQGANPINWINTATTSTANDNTDADSIISLLGTSTTTPVLAPGADDYNSTAAAAAFLSSRYQLFSEYAAGNWSRQYTGAAYLGRDIVNPNGESTSPDYCFRVIDRTKVTKIHFKNVRTNCTHKYCNCSSRVRPHAVDAWVDNSCVTFNARYAVILAAGSVETPALLQRSGVGPSAVLDGLCIKKVITNDNVGANALTQAGFNLEYEIFNTNATATSVIEAQLSILGELLNSTLTTGIPSTIYPSGYVPARAQEILSQGYSTAPSSVVANNNPRYLVNVQGYNLVPWAAGNVNIVAHDAFTPPAVNVPSFSATQEQTAIANLFVNIVNSIKAYVVAYNTANPATPIQINWPDVLPQAVMAPPNTPLVIGANGSGVGNVTVEEIMKYISDNNLKSRLVGTAKMGVNGGGVVGDDFQVFGTCGLYVADLSILPIMPDADPEWMEIVIGLMFANKLALCSTSWISRRTVQGNGYSLSRFVICKSCNSEPCCCTRRGAIIINNNDCGNDDGCCDDVLYGESSSSVSSCKPVKTKCKKGCKSKGKKCKC